MSLARGLAVLQQVSQAPTGCSFVELRDGLGLPNATASRLIVGMTEAGWLERDQNRYRPGTELRRVAANEPLAERLQRCAQPFLVHLFETCANTVLLLQWTGGHALCLDRMLHEDSLVLQQPGHVTQNLFGAPWGYFFLDAAKWEAAFRTRPRPVGAVRARYREELKRLSEHGYCVAPSEDKQRVAAPIYFEEHIVGCLVVGGTTSSLQNKALLAAGAAVAEAAQQCSLALQGGGHSARI